MNIFLEFQSVEWLATQLYARAYLIPEIRYKESSLQSAMRFTVFLAGIGVMVVIRLFAH